MTTNSTETPAPAGRAAFQERLRSGFKADPAFAPLFIALAFSILTVLFHSNVLAAESIDLKITANYHFDRYHPGGDPRETQNYDRAAESFEKKDIRKTFFYLNNVIKYNQFSREAYNLYGAALLYSGDYENATELFRKSANLDPRYKCPYMNLGLMYLKLEKWRELESVANRYLRVDPDDFDANLGMGIAAFHLFCYAEAEKYLDAAWETRTTCSRKEYLDALADYRARARAKNRRLY